MSQHIYNECGRLLANNIILYNTRLLSTLLEVIEKGHDIEKIALLKRILPVAWQHINIYGKYEFNRIFERVPMKVLIERMHLDFKTETEIAL